MKPWTPIWFVLSLALAASQAQANSYVGNGGSQGDVELAVTLMQIRETFTAIEKKSGSDASLCECNRMYKGRPICEPLSALSEEQTKFCNQTLFKIAPQIQKLAQESDKIHIRWTNDSIEVNDGGHASRASDAVANRERREIVVNLSRFLGMDPAERVFLLSHEFMHFATLDGKPLTDKGAIGPFAGEDGSRALLNAMAAAAGVMKGAYPKEIKGYKAKRFRSQASKPFWFGLDFGATQVFGEYKDKFNFNNYQRGQFSFRYQWPRFGLMVAYRHEEQDGSVKSTIKTSEKIDSVGVGPTYRIFFSDDPLTFWGQSHILIHALVEAVHGSYKYYEDVPGYGKIGSDDSTTVFGGNVGVNYYIPIFFGFWVYLGGSIEYHPYRYTKADVNLNYDKPLYSGNIGVSYAF